MGSHELPIHLSRRFPGESLRHANWIFDTSCLGGHADFPAIGGLRAQESELTVSKDAELLALATAICDGQSAEIKQKKEMITRLS
jgi:hypothetical protein